MVVTRGGNGLALLVEAAHRGAHALGRNEDDVDVVAELVAASLHVPCSHTHTQTHANTPPQVVSSLP